MGKKTLIQVDKGTANTLIRLKKIGDTYDSVISRLLFRRKKRDIL